jgi:MoxR-like ATPase
VNASEALTTALAEDLPVALYGPPGVGKTALVEAAALALGLDLHVVVASLRDPTDFAGLPVVHEGVVRLAPPAWATAANGAGNGALVFFDDLSAAMPATQAAALRVLRERVVGDVPLGPRVRLCAAYNPANAGGLFELETTVRTRLLHIEVRPDAEAVAEGLLGRWPQPGTPVPPTAQCRTAWRLRVAAFLRARPSLVYVEAGDGEGGAPTPRTWEMTARAAAAGDAAGGRDLIATLVSGAVGHAAAAEFLAYADNLDLPDPAEMLRDPDRYTLPIDPERPDRTWAWLSAVAERAVADGTPEAWEAAWTIAGRAAEEGAADLVVMVTRVLTASQPPGAALPPMFGRIRAALERAA